MLFKKQKELKIMDLSKGLLKDQEKQKMIQTINKSQHWKSFYHSEQLLTDYLPSLKKSGLPKKFNVREIIQ